MSTTIRTFLTTAAAAGMLSLAIAAPAAAVPERDLRGPQASTGPDQGFRGSKASTPTILDPEPQVVVKRTRFDDGGVEYLQIGLGVVAGMTVAGAATVGLYRLGDRRPHPA